IAEAEMVFVCIDRLGRAAPIPDEIARFLGPRVSGGHQPIQVQAGDVELAVDVRGESVPVVFVHGFPFDRTVWRHQLATLSRVRRIAPDLRGVGGAGAPPAPDGAWLPRRVPQAASARVAEQVREMARRRSVRGLGGALGALRDRPDSTETLRGVRVPTLVLVGSDDEIAPPETARAMAQLIPGAQCHV